MAWADYTGELLGTVPRLPPSYAGTLVNRAWARIRDFRLWSFNYISDAQIFVPAVISAGAVTCTFGSTQVTANAAATTAFNAVGFGPPPLTGPLGTGRQLRIGQVNGLNSPTGPLYTLLSFVLNGDGTSTLTLDKAYGETSVTNSFYQVLKAYYAAPAWPFTSGTGPNQTADANFVRFTSIINRFNGYSFRGKNLNWSQEQLNAIDPQRGGQGDAYIQANYGRAAAGTPVFELYPNPVNFTTYNGSYITRWPDVSPVQDLPQMPYDLVGCVGYLSKCFAAQWALANVGTFEELGKTNWVAYLSAMKAEFKEALVMCIKTDDELLPQQAYRQGSGFDFPLGGQFLQSHDVSSLVSG